MSASTAIRVPSPNAIALTGTESNWLSVSFSAAGAGDAGDAGGAGGGAGGTPAAGPLAAAVPGLGTLLAMAGVGSSAAPRGGAAQPMSHRQEPKIRPSFICPGELSSDRGKPRRVNSSKRAAAGFPA